MIDDMRGMQIVHGSNANPVPTAADVRTSMQIEQEEEEVGGEVAMELSKSTPEELAIAVAITHTPTPGHIHSTTLRIPTRTPAPTSVSSHMPTAMHIYSIVLSTCPNPSALVTICDAITDTVH